MDVSENRVLQNGWFIMENLTKMDALGVPLSLETPISNIVQSKKSFPGTRKLDWLLCYARWLQPCVMVNGNSCWAQVFNRKASHWESHYHYSYRHPVIPTVVRSIFGVFDCMSHMWLKDVKRRSRTKTTLRGPYGIANRGICLIFFQSP